MEGRVTVFMGKPDVHVQEIENRPHLMSYLKVKSRWIKGLNIRPETSRIKGKGGTP